MARPQRSAMVQMSRVSEMSAADFRARLRGLSETVTRERAGFDSAGRLPDDLYHKLAEIGLNRKMLSEMAIHDAKGFEQVAAQARAALEAQGSGAEHPDASE